MAQPVARAGAHLPDTDGAEEAYVAWIKRFIVFHGKRHPCRMGGPEVTAFLSHLAVHGQVAASTQSLALSALLFRCGRVLAPPLALPGDVERAKAPARLPVVLTRDEVRRVLALLEGTPRLVATLRGTTMIDTNVLNQSGGRSVRSPLDGL